MKKLYAVLATDEINGCYVRKLFRRKWDAVKYVAKWLGEADEDEITDAVKNITENFIQEIEVE